MPNFIKKKTNKFDKNSQKINKTNPICWSSLKQIILNKLIHYFIFKKNFFFSRKIKSFNKSRYSRNRQNTRVIFYFSLYINILVIFSVFSILYGLMFNFSYIWFFIFLFFFSLFFSSFLRISRRIYLYI